MGEELIKAGGKPLGKRAGHSVLLVRLIAVSKCLKSACLIVVGIFLLHMINLNRDVHDTLLGIVNAVRLDENNRFIHTLLEKTLGISAAKLRLIYTGTLVYAGLYLLEGVGLFMDKAWAEWMTIITTAGFIPLEVWEIIDGPTVTKCGVFALNMFILVYLILRLKWRFAAKKELGLATGEKVRLKETQGLGGK